MTNFENKQTKTGNSTTFQEVLEKFISSGDRNPNADIYIDESKSKKHQALVDRLMFSTPYNINLNINKGTILR